MVKISYPLKQYGKIYNGKQIYWFTSNYFWLCDYDNDENLNIITNPITIYSLDPDDDYLTDSDTYPEYFAIEEKVNLFYIAKSPIDSKLDAFYYDILVKEELKDKRFLEAVTIR